VTPPCITLHETSIGVRRYYSTCEQHPDWRPMLQYSRDAAVGDAEQHVYQEHDGVDRAGMPDALIRALSEVSDPRLRLRLARAARRWAAPDEETPDGPLVEWGVTRRGLDLQAPHRTGMSEATAREWIAEFVRDGGKPGAFTPCCRTVGPWRKARP